MSRVKVKPKLVIYVFFCFFFDNVNSFGCSFIVSVLSYLPQVVSHVEAYCSNGGDC